MPLISEHFIDEIQSRIDIAELIGRYIPLKRNGRNFKALCPFHKERTPSFMVNTDKQIFHCFGCGVGGNIFSFIMQHDRLTFPEAVRQLADHIGMRVPEAAGKSDPANQQLMDLTERACKFFERNLNESRQGGAARNYVESRGVSAESRNAFRLGLALPGWRTLLTAAQKDGIAPEELETAGLAIRSQSGFYDRFRERLLFPIQDARGRVVGFGGRSLGEQQPKYLNSPETALYHKGDHLFGLAQAKDAIVSQKCAVVVEGYFDCVVLASAGLGYVVSPLGTAMTPEQVRLLKRYAERVVLAFDADAAGETATLRGIDLLVDAGLEVRIARFPSGMDPDEFVQTNGLAGLESVIHGAVTIFDFLVDHASRRYSLKTIEDRVKAAQSVLPTVARVRDAMLRSEYVRLLADRLKLDEQSVSQELARQRGKGEPTGNAGLGTGSRLPAQGAERVLTALVLEAPELWSKIRKDIRPESITHPSCRGILKMIDECERETQAMTPAQVATRLAEEGSAALVSELVEFAQHIPAKEAAFEECVARIRKQIRARRLDGLREEMQAAQRSGQDDSKLRSLLLEYQRLMKEAKVNGESDDQ